MEIIISILGALTAIIVAVVGALLSYRSSNKLQILELKEEHYIAYVAALHNLGSNNTKDEYIQQYTFCRDSLLLVGSEEVINAILIFEKNAIGKKCEKQDHYFTAIIKAIRKDLKLKDKDFPHISLTK